MSEIEALIKKLSPLMEEGSEIFKELAVFFGPGSKIATHQGDLAKFLGRKRLYRVLRLSGSSYKDCVYQLVDEHPESMEALGMLRYYTSPGGSIKWEDIEAAEIALGKELTTNAYGWMPDAWTAFENADDAQGTGTHQLVALLAFDYGD
jgi:hypothetical protein